MSAVHSRQSTADCGPYVLWAEIESIEYIGREQVYDLQVKGAHNFIANGIIAHNTYISATSALRGRGQIYEKV